MPDFEENTIAPIVPIVKYVNLTSAASTIEIAMNGSQQTMRVEIIRR